MRPYRVLLVSHYYPPHLGGIENVVRQEALHLAALGVEVTVLTSGERAGTETADGVRVVRVAAWNGVERRTGVPFPVLSPRSWAARCAGPAGPMPCTCTTASIRPAGRPARRPP